MVGGGLEGCGPSQPLPAVKSTSFHGADGADALHFQRSASNGHLFVATMVVEGWRHVWGSVFRVRGSDFCLLSVVTHGAVCNTRHRGFFAQCLSNAVNSLSR